MYNKSKVTQLMGSTSYIMNASDTLVLFLYIMFVSFTYTVKILKIGTPEIITIIVLQLEQMDFTVQYCVQKMQTE